MTPSSPDAVTADAVTPEPTFADFGVHADIVAALAEHGIVHPFPIQAMTLPIALGGHDIIGQAKTGTGKTLGFGVPILQKVVAPGDEGFAKLARPGKPQALAVAPTRELAVQVSGDLERAGAQRGIRVLTVYGGRAYEPQVEALKRGVEVVVGTPGRLIDLAKQGYLDLSQARTVVLDEADEMLDLGFLPDVETLMSLTPAGRQTMLFSATMPGAIVALARRYMTQPTHIRAMGDDTENAHTVTATRQVVYRAHSLDKVELLSRVLQAKDRGLTLIFTRTKRAAAKVSDELVERGFAAAAIHGDLGQGAREQALRAFRNGKVDVLVCTDVAARGLDIKDVPAVFNYDVPFNAEDYVHRIGRTGRAGASGLAVTLVSGSDARLVADIEKLIKKKIDLEAIEYEEDRPRVRINDGRRAWRESGEMGDPRDAIPGAVRERSERREPREPREHHRGFRPAVASRDPFFEKPYEPSNADTAPAWEAAAKSPARSSISANIKPKRKVAALFKAVQPETSTQ